MIVCYKSCTTFEFFLDTRRFKKNEDEIKDDSPKMALSLVDAEKKLIEVGAITRKRIEKTDKLPFTGYGRSKWWMRASFMKAVKKDYSVFFPSEPDRSSLLRTANKLFRYGGNRALFPTSPSQSEIQGTQHFAIQPQKTEEK